MLNLLLFIFGIFIGSFLNLVIDRLPRNEGIFFGRSHCDYCGHTLSWYDLFPLFSFLFLWGKCRYCYKFIGWKYPLLEIITGVSFALLPFVVSLQNLSIFLLSLGFIICFIIIFFVDLFYGIIPDSILIILVILTVLNLFLTKGNLLIVLSGSIGAGVLFLILYFVTKKRGIGFGDVKYAFVMGFLLGFPHIILALYIAFLTGAAIAFILILGKKKTLKSAVPFGPFLVLGTVCIFFYGNTLWNIFLHLLNLI